MKNQDGVLEIVLCSNIGTTLGLANCKKETASENVLCVITDTP